MNFYDLLINHPGRILILQCYNYHCTAATPPSKATLCTQIYELCMLITILTMLI